MLKKLIKKLLYGPFFRGQDRLFHFFFKKGFLNDGNIVVKPREGNFEINCNTSTWIGARIVYIGDYEPEVKNVFKQYIQQNNTVLDIGANIGLHSLYFSELVGNAGSVISYEPVQQNFVLLEQNVKQNGYNNIEIRNIALGNKNEAIGISIDVNSSNPGSYNLFDNDGQVMINCRIGDEVVDQPVDFIKIDVEGYEAFVIDGLTKTIRRDLPKILFEYDPFYHHKTKLPKDFIFQKLLKLGYTFYKINRKNLEKVIIFDQVKSCNILALVDDN